MNYAEKAMQYKGKSLDDMCMMTIVTKSDLTDNDRATLVKDGWELDDEFVNEWIPQEEMTKLEGNYDDFETEWDFDEFDNIINDIKYERSLADREDFRFADQFMKKLEEEVYETNG